MPKAGSTALQAALHGAGSGPGWTYLASPGRNHYGTLLALYGGGERPWTRARPDAARRAEAQAAAARADLDRLAGTDATLVVSSEALWSPRRGPMRAALLADLAARGAEVSALAYLRPPLSFAVSHFAQRLKHFDAFQPFGLRGAFWGYRAAIEALDRDLGGALTLRPFRRESLRNGDVVADFLNVTALAAPPQDLPAVRANVALSAEATALLYAARARGLAVDPTTKAGAQAVADLLADLAHVGGRRLTFAASAWAPVLDRHREDIAWTEARLGASLAEAPDEGAVAIGSEDDLLALADEAARLDAARLFLDRVAALSAPAAPAARPPRTRTG